MALTGFINPSYTLANVPYDDKIVGGGSYGTMPGYVTAKDLNSIKSAFTLNNQALSDYSDDIHATIEALSSKIENKADLITEREEVKVQVLIETFQRLIR